MNSAKKLWWALGLMFVVSFAALALIGGEIYRKAAPMPERVVTSAGTLVFDRAAIEQGRQVWQTAGGQEIGSIWGHGAYVAPDWSADWLHREATGLLDRWALREYQRSYAQLDTEKQAGLRARLEREMRANTYDASTRTITISEDRAAVVRAVAAHYTALFGTDPQLSKLRDQYAIAEGAIASERNRELMPAFFFWTAWAATTQRPGAKITYTNNWPHEPLVGNLPSVATGMWSIASIILLLAAVGAMVWYHASQKGHAPTTPPARDPFLGLTITPSMRATMKYFYTVIALFLAQIVLGAVTAHYAVEGQAFYGIPLAEVLPYAVARTWHTQLGIFWIATAWLATGLYIAPALSGAEPKHQKLGVNLLYVALLVVVVGSMTGEWLGVEQRLGLDVNFWLGHQGWEFVDLGRVWQILLFAGLLIWLGLMARALAPALRRQDESRPLVWLLFLSTMAIGLFYGAGLTWGQHTHISMIEYWRWWVVHLWVEGFFEVFATAIIALLFARLGLVRAATATTATLFATVVFLFGGILGTLHHLYFSGTTEPVIAIGAMFSALEVVPLVLLGFEAMENWGHFRAVPWMNTYRWPVMFFIAVSFWNLVGAGLFGFLINPPISLYYLQGLNTTPNHGHAALFGVYGMLGIGLMLFCLRGLASPGAWKESLLKPAFWLLNVGLAGMVLLSLLPAGIYQAYASITQGLWYARSAEVIHSPVMQALVWMRVPGDILFSAGAACLAVFALRMWLADRRIARDASAPASPVAAR